MNIINTADQNLEKDGWELLTNEKEAIGANPGDIVKIGMAIVSPLDFDEGKTIRSVSHIELWAEVENIQEDVLIGVLKSNPGHETEIKDGTKFKIGDRITFRKQNIIAKR